MSLQQLIQTDTRMDIRTDDTKDIMFMTLANGVKVK